MSSDDNLSTVLDQVFKNMLGEMHVSMPAQIVSYDYSAQRASVKPTVSRKYKDGRVDPWPVIENVPVIWPRSGGASLTMPVRDGDPVLLIFTDRTLDDYMASGGVQAQSDPRMHSLNDAVAIAGLVPFATPSQAENNDDVLMTYDGNDFRLRPDGHAELQSAKRIILKCGASTITMTPDGIVIDAPRIDLNP